MIVAKRHNRYANHDEITGRLSFGADWTAEPVVSTSHSSLSHRLIDVRVGHYLEVCNTFEYIVRQIAEVEPLHSPISPMNFRSLLENRSLIQTVLVWALKAPGSPQKTPRSFKTYQQCQAS